MKICRDCNKETNSDCLVKNKAFSDGYDTLCLICNRKRTKEWRKRNPEKRKLQRSRENKKDYSHSKHLKHTLGITHDDWQKLFEDQEGCCAICHKHQVEFTKRLFVDHDHKTGQIRQLLCSSCNSVLGYAKDNPEILSSAIDYLKRHKQDTNYAD